jgi:hypothetical protein
MGEAEEKALSRAAVVSTPKVDAMPKRRSFLEN